MSFYIAFSVESWAMAALEEQLARSSVDNGNNRDHQNACYQNCDGLEGEAKYLDKIVVGFGIAAEKITTTFHEHGEHQIVYLLADQQEAHSTFIEYPISKMDQLSKAVEGIVLRVITNANVVDANDYSSEDSNNSRLCIDNNNNLDASNNKDCYVPQLEANICALCTLRAHS